MSEIDTSTEAVEREIAVACIADTPLATLLRALVSERDALMTSPAPDREARELALLEWYWQLVGHEMYGDREQLGYPEPGNFAACLAAFNATQKDKSDAR